MDRIFLFFKGALEKIARLGLNYYVALGLFSVCILVAAIRLVVVNATGKIGRGSVAIFVFYEIVFFLNVVLCLSESAFSGKYFESGADAYAFCLSQFAVCMFFWFALFFDERKICASKKGTDAEDESRRGIIRCGAAAARSTKRAITDSYAGLSEEKEAADDGFCEKEETMRGCVDTSDESVDDEIETESELFSDGEKEKPTSTRLMDKVFFAGKIPDVNVGYVNNLITALKAKNIQPDEKDKLDELQIILKRLPADAKGRARMNELLRFLLKKIAEYDVPA